MKRLSSLLFLLLLLWGCGYVYHEQVLGNYYLTAVDSMTQLSLGYQNPEPDICPYIVAHGVYEVLHNERYIVVKKHPNFDPPSQSELNKAVTEYYIVKIVHTDSFDDKDCLGPFAEKEYIAKKRELKIDRLVQDYPSRQSRFIL